MVSRDMMSQLYEGVAYIGGRIDVIVCLVTKILFLYAFSSINILVLIKFIELLKIVFMSRFYF